MTDALETTIPVPGCERLVWREPALKIPATGNNHLPELVARGADVGLLFSGGPFGNIDELSSLTIEQPFATWPPRLGAPAVHAPRELANSPFKVAPWLDDELVFLLGEPFAVRCGEAGARSLGIDVVKRDQHGRPMGARMGSARPYVGANPAHGIYMVRSRRKVSDGPLFYSLEHRSAARLDVVQELGDLAQGSTLCAVLDDGSFLFAEMHAPRGVRVPKGPRRPKNAPIYYEVELFRAADGRVESCGRLPAPPETNATAIVPATGGGAWISFIGPRTEAVLRVDGSGRHVGEPWLAPFPRGGHHRTKLARWRDGFMLATERTSLAILASDGVRTTRVASRSVGDQNIHDHFAVLSSPDGRSILLAHSILGHIQVLRADFEASSADTSADVWADDRAAMLRATEATTRQAALPKRFPGRPVETSEDGAEPETSHAKPRIVARARLHYLLNVVWCLHHDDEPAFFRGTNDEGRFHHYDGSGNMTFIAWSRDGLVAVGFDSDKPAPGGGDPEDPSPEQCFPDAPPKLAALVAEVIAQTRSRTGGLWVTTGDDARYHAEGELTDDFPRYFMTADAALTAEGHGHPWGVEMSPWGPIAARLADAAAMGTHTITPEEEKMLLALPDGGAIDPRRQERAVKAFAAAGVRWGSATDDSPRETPPAAPTHRVRGKGGDTAEAPRPAPVDDLARVRAELEAVPPGGPLHHLLARYALLPDATVEGIRLILEREPRLRSGIGQKKLIAIAERAGDAELVARIEALKKP